MKRILDNVLYQALYQLLQVILPVITVPIVSGSLGPKGLGIFNFTSSITNYFVLFAGLGLSNYGVREIARCRDNKNSLSRKFFELEGMNILISIIIIAVYFSMVAIMNRYKSFYVIEFLLIIAAVLDISWFYIGIEDFSKVSLSNMIIKVISFILIVLTIHNYSDLKLYVVIQCGSTFLSQSILWFFLKNRIDFVRVNFISMVKHIKPAAAYFISKIAISLYTNLNKTLLGILGTVSAVGYYSNGVTLYTMIAMVMTSVDEALMPRMSKMVSDGNKTNAIKLMEKVVHISLWITIPAMFGLIAISSKLVDWFFSPKFALLKILIPIFAPLVVIIPLGVSIARQYLVPTGNIKGYNISVIFAGIISIFINVITISKMGVYGTVLATCVSESFNTIIRVFELIKHTDFHFHLSLIIRYFIMGIVMALAIYCSTRQLSSSVVTTMIQISIGVIVYGFLSIVTKTPLSIKQIESIFKQEH